MSMPLPPACPDGQLYTVARGDTLFLLAQRFGTTVEALRAANPQITNPNVLVIGQRICIPRVAPPAPPPPRPLPAPPACPGGTIHTVAPGETMASIARRYGMSLSQLIAANPQVTDPNVLAIGQRLCIPGRVERPIELPPPPACPGGRIHTVATGESLWSISRRYGLTLAQLLQANPQIREDTTLFPGQQLCIPIPGPVTPPGVPPACPGGTIAVVGPGDTMTSIARRFGVTVEELIRANPQVADPDVLVPGQQLCVPLGLIPGPGHLT
ncbi:MAG: LysM peptidoglycan-binding domain-containing protein [Bacillota bacterium]|nr:LysM peptidoglycan-binding domain-containing protein [Bacillota bacterium]